MKLKSQMDTSCIQMELLNVKDFVEYSQENIDFQDKVCYDYKSLNTDDIMNFINENPQALEIINLDSEYNIETLAKKKYNDINFFDLILILNNREMVLGMPKNNDLLEEEVETLTQNYFSNPEAPYQGNSTQELVEAYKNSLLEKKIEENVERQYFTILKPEYKKQFLRTTKYKI